MAKILIADDEPKIRELVRKYAEFEGHSVEEAEDGAQAVSLCSCDDFDVVILDVMMPVMDGFAALRQIRKAKDIPVIMLSARGEEYDRLKGFELGVDDYVVKPFSVRELMMRVNVVVKRHESAKNARFTDNATEPGQIPHEIYTYKTLCLDRSSRTLTIDGEPRELTFKEYELLTCLLDNKGLALTREQLLSKVWGYDYYGDDRTLDTHIKLLRNAMDPYRDLIVTIRNVGYRFDDTKA